MSSIALNRNPVRDLISLTKPRVTSLVLITTAGGMMLAPTAPSWGLVLITLVATWAVVGSANTLNCWLERDADGRMSRTRHRPLPAGRLPPAAALWFGLFLGAVSIPILAIFVNPLTALVAATALVAYVAVYTPLKQRSSIALLVGAVPGALPPLMGWTAVTGELSVPAVVLFGVLFLWQVPHFIAIAIVRKDEYQNAGMKVLPAVRGERTAKFHAIAYAGALVPVSLLLVPLGVAGRVYFGIALVMGIGFFVTTLTGLRRSAGRTWARRLFFVSLVYLTMVFAALMTGL